MLEPAILKQGVRLIANVERYSNTELENTPQPTMEISMDALIEKLDAKLRQWKPDVAQQVQQCVAEIIEDDSLA